MTDYIEEPYELRGLYTPMPELPIELVGGHSDGRRVSLPNLPFVQVPIPPKHNRSKLLFIKDDDPISPIDVQVDLYAMGEISDETHCWRYHFVSTR